MNEKRFDGLGGIYNRFRPSYPREMIEFLIESGIINGESAVADVGSGTGKLTAVLLSEVKTVYAVEPNFDMRKNAEADLKSFPNFVSVDGTAENTTLENNSVDCVTAAQAFHWFDRESFKKECKRILKPNGKVVLIWNSRDGESPLVQKNESLNRKYCQNFKGFSNNMRAAMESGDFSDFFKGEYQEKIFDFPIEFNEEGFIGRNLSSSYAPKEDEENYQGYVKALKELFSEFSKDGRLIMPNLTRIYLGSV